MNKNKKIIYFKIYKKNKIIGYSVLAKEKIMKLDTLMFLLTKNI